MARGGGLEPPTLGLRCPCSIQLSYPRIGLKVSAFGVRLVLQHLPDAPTHFFRPGGSGDEFHSSGFSVASSESSSFGKRPSFSYFDHMTFAASPDISQSLAACSGSLNLAR